MLYINIHFKQTCCNGHRASLLTCNKQGVIPLIYGRNIKQAVDSERNTRLKWNYANCALKCERGSRVAFNISSLFTRVAQQNRLPQSTPAYCTECHNPLAKKKNTRFGGDFFVVCSNCRRRSVSAAYTYPFQAEYKKKLLE